MGFYFSTIKSLTFIFNVLCLIFGIGGFTLGAVGLQGARVGTDEHSYYIVAMTLASLVCMATFFGSYGVICELLSVNIVYMFFLLILLLVQYFQIHSFQAFNFYFTALKSVDQAWRKIEFEPSLMAAIEQSHHCCGFESYHDYADLSLDVPASCYQAHPPASNAAELPRGCRPVLEMAYVVAAQREHVFGWTMFITECICLVYTAVLATILGVQWRRQRNRPLFTVPGYVERCANHVRSRTLLT